MKTVIYKIENTLNKNCYIGSTNNYTKRKRTHFRDLENNQHHSIKLQRAYNKYGKENFIIFEIEIFNFISKKVTLEREQYYLDTLKPKYNICLVAGSQLGAKRDTEFKRNCSIRMTGKIAWNKGKKIGKQSDETVAKRKKAMTGNIVTTETRNKISKSNKGKKLSESHIKKLSESKLKNPVNNIKIGQYLNGVLINVYMSISEASKETGLKYKTIKNSLNNINRKWKWKSNVWDWKVQIS